VRSGIGAEERERPSSSSGGSRERRVLVVVVATARYDEGEGEREVREEVLVLGVLEREMQAYGWCTVTAESEEGRYGYL